MKRSILALLALLATLIFTATALATPVNTELPKLSGEAKVGATLETTNGKWSPEGTAFGYSWERCNTSGLECVFEGEGEGFNSKTYKLREVDSGHTVRSLVADVCGGLCFVFAKSAPSATVEPEKRTKECFPEHEAECGYPSRSTVGVEPGQELTASGGIVAKTEGQEIHNLKITGNVEGPYIEVKASHVRIKNVEIVVNNLRHAVCEEHKVTSGLGIIRLGANFGHWTDLKIEHVTIHATGEECGTEGNLGGDDVMNSNVGQAPEDIVVKASSFYNSAMCFNGPMTVEGSYCDVNGDFTGQHYDGAFLQAGSAIYKGNTIIVPHSQTAPLAIFNGAGQIENVTAEGNLLAGGDFAAYGGNKCPGVKHEVSNKCSLGEPGESVTGVVKMISNRIARCTGTEITGEGGHYCEGFPPTTSLEGYGNQPIDVHGYWPKGGFLGTWGEFLEEGGHSLREGNVFDDNNAAAN